MAHRFVNNPGYQSMVDFPDVWIRLDPEFQRWQGERLHGLVASVTGAPAWPELDDTYRVWRDKPGNFAKPLHRMLEEDQAAHGWFRAWLDKDGSATAWREMRSLARDVAEYRQSGQEWSREKIDAYNQRLSGRILIPQPAGAELRLDLAAFRELEAFAQLGTELDATRY